VYFSQTSDVNSRSITIGADFYAKFDCIILDGATVGWNNVLLRASCGVCTSIMPLMHRACRRRDAMPSQ
jgi:hypothetical protein